MQDLSVCSIQAALVWEDVAANLNAFSERISDIGDNPDLIILPEMFSTGFSMNSSALAEKMDGRSISWMAEQESTTGAVITGSLIIEQNGNYYNRLIWMRPDGTFSHYDKRHLFRMMEEDQSYAAGREKLFVNLNGWAICPLICYDLRFPVWSRNRGDYDVLIYVANWPKPRRDAWRTLLRARAHENQAYVIGLNRVGMDMNEIAFAGDSVMIDPKGSLISEAGEEEKTLQASLNYLKLQDFRAKFPTSLDADSFSFEL